MLCTWFSWAQSVLTLKFVKATCGVRVMVYGIVVDGSMVSWLVMTGCRVKWSCINWGRFGMGMSTVVCQGQCGQGRKDGDLEGGLG